MRLFCVLKLKTFDIEGYLKLQARCYRAWGIIQMQVLVPFSTRLSNRQRACSTEVV